MKIERIQISAFGSFSQVQFGPFSDRVVIIHGPHEAGISTLQTFIRAMLFGFPRSGLSAVQHVTASGRYGGRLLVRDSARRTFAIERYLETHSGEARVTTPDHSIAGEAGLDELLAHTSSELYQAVFTFGAEDLYTLAAVPDDAASRRMYAASLGADRLPELLDHFQRQARATFDPDGRDEPVLRLLRALDEIEHALTRAQDAVDAYHDLRQRHADISLEIGVVDRQIAAINRIEQRFTEAEERRTRTREHATHDEDSGDPNGPARGRPGNDADQLRREIDELRESWTRLQAMQRMYDVYQATVARQRLPRSPWFLALLMVGVMLPVVSGAITGHSLVLTLGIASGVLGMVLLVLAAIARSRFESAQLQALLHLEMTHREAQGRFLHAALVTRIDPARIEDELVRIEQVQAALAATETGQGHQPPGARESADEEWRALAPELDVPVESATSPAAARGALEGRRDELLISRGRLDEQIQQLEGDRRNAELRFKREELLTQLGDHMRAWSTNVLARRLLRDAFHAYGASHLPEILAFASDTFDAMTLGAYHQLRAEADGEGIVALGRDGREVSVATMSRGTRAQAYLALRIGLIRANGRRERPLPVLVDDILANFDPERALEAMRALGSLTPDHQVFIFTSHPSTVALARFVMPGASLIPLGEQTMSDFAPLWLDNA